MTARPLNAKQQRFVAEYLIDLNATQAAIRAGYSAKNANQHGYRLLTIPEIAAAVADGNARRLSLLDMTHADVLRELAVVAFGRLTNVATWNGRTIRLKPSEALTKDDAALVAEVGMTRHGPTVKMADKVGALKTLHAHFQLIQKGSALVAGDGGSDPDTSAGVDYSDDVELTEPEEGGSPAA